MILSVTQVIVAAVLITLILLQERSGGMSGLLGGGDSGSFYHARRGMEKFIFAATIGATVAFVGLSIVQLLV